MVRLGHATVGILYETGATTSYDTVEFRRIPVGDLGE
jgi:sialidase-1